MESHRNFSEGSTSALWKPVLSNHTVADFLQIQDFTGLKWDPKSGTCIGLPAMDVVSILQLLAKAHGEQEKKKVCFSNRSGFWFHFASIKPWMPGTEEKLWNMQNYFM